MTTTEAGKNFSGGSSSESSERRNRFVSPGMERYIRQTVLPEIGETGQRRLMDSSVLVVGVGGLGSTLAQLLCAAGVGRLVLVDPDTVSESNLQRQILYRTDEVGLPKAECAKRSLQRLNPYVRIDAHKESFRAVNAISLASGCDLIADGSDNAAARYCMNDVSFGLRIPYVYGSIEGFRGQVSVFNSGAGSATYRCLFPEHKCDASPCRQGVVGPLPSFVASIQANECIKILAGFGEILSDRLLLADMIRMQTFSVSIEPTEKGHADSLQAFRSMHMQKESPT